MQGNKDDKPEKNKTNGDDLLKKFFFASCRNKIKIEKIVK